MGAWVGFRVTDWHDTGSRRSWSWEVLGVPATAHTVTATGPGRCRVEIAVIPGMEVSTDAGHVLTFGVDHYTLEMYSVERLRHIVESEGGAMVLAHPTRSPGFGRPWEQAPELFEALECMNGDDHHGASSVVFSLASSLGMWGTGGSDAHSRQAVARCVTRFERHIQDEHELAEALREGGYQPLLRSPEGAYVVPPALARREPAGGLLLGPNRG